jgi:hypothetical protein
MAKAKNKVIAGDYEGKFIGSAAGLAHISIGMLKSVYLNNSNVSSYELITDEHRKSAASGVVRGVVGGALLGPVGMLAGGMSAKNKGIYQVAVEFNDGKRSLLEVDDKLYKAIVKNCF